MQTLYRKALNRIYYYLTFVVLVVTLFWFFQEDLLHQTLSAIGRNNEVVFIAWSVVSAVSIMLAFILISFKLDVIKSKGKRLKIAIIIVSIFCAVAKIVSNSTLGQSETDLAIHLTFSLSYGVTALLMINILVFLTAAQTKNARLWVVFVFFMITCLIFLLMIILVDFIALAQLIVYIAGTVILLVLNSYLGRQE